MHASNDTDVLREQGEKKKRALKKAQAKQAAQKAKATAAKATEKKQTKTKNKARPPYNLDADENHVGYDY